MSFWLQPSPLLLVLTKWSERKDLWQHLTKGTHVQAQMPFQQRICPKEATFFCKAFQQFFFTLQALPLTKFPLLHVSLWCHPIIRGSSCFHSKACHCIKASEENCQVCFSSFLPLLWLPTFALFSFKCYQKRPNCLSSVALLVPGLQC